MRETDKRYLKIGTFVITSLVLVIIGLIILGSGKVFQRAVAIETYFDESVQGISLGSPVKYRGLQIGYVKEIAFVNEVYNNHHNHDVKISSRYIYVKMIITSPFFTKLTKKELKHLLARNTKQGLRIKLSPQGLTGTAYLELNFVDPEANHILEIHWKPRNAYIPSCPSMITQFSDNVQYVFNELKGAHLKTLFENTQIFTESAQHISQKIDRLLNKVNQPVEMTVMNLQNISENLRALAERMRLYPAQAFLGSPPPPLDPHQL